MATERRRGRDEAADFWELIEDHDVGDTYRLAVPGGWLYRVREVRQIDDPRGPVAVALVFVPTDMPR